MIHNIRRRRSTLVLFLYLVLLVMCIFLSRLPVIFLGLGASFVSVCVAYKDYSSASQ